MPDLDFQIEFAEVTPYAAAPQLALSFAYPTAIQMRRFIP